MGGSLAQRIAPIIGAFYVVIGIVGFFVTGFDNFVANTPEALVGFSINPFHNLVHLAIGAFLIIMSTAFSTPIAEGAVMGVGLFYIVAFAIGVIAPDNLTILSMYGRGDLENLNHVVAGVALLALGLAAAAATSNAMRKQGIA
jgi:hypothetical protein